MLCCVHREQPGRNLGGGRITPRKRTPMADIAKELRGMHAMAANSCDPQFNRAILKAAAEIERLRAALASCEARAALSTEQKGSQG